MLITESLIVMGSRRVKNLFWIKSQKICCMETKTVSQLEADGRNGDDDQQSAIKLWYNKGENKIHLESRRHKSRDAIKSRVVIQVLGMLRDIIRSRLWREKNGQRNASFGDLCAIGAVMQMAI